MFAVGRRSNAGVKTMRLIGLTVSLALTLFAISHVNARDYKKDDFRQSRGFSTSVVTDGGKTVWLAGMNALVDEQGRSLAGNLEGQARATLRQIDAAVKDVGGSLRDVVTMTVYLTDPRQLCRVLLRRPKRQVCAPALPRRAPARVTPRG